MDRADLMVAHSPPSRPTSGWGLADALVVTEGAVEKRISNIFGKLHLAPSDTAHRRVLAALAFLRS
jgi:hypothetical protein